MAGIAITTATEVNQLTGNLVLNYMQLLKQVHEVKASLDATELLNPPFSMSQADSDQIKGAFALMASYATNIEAEVNFIFLKQLVNFRTF